MISTWSPPRSLAWQKGSRLDSGLTLKLLGLLLLVGSLGVSCKRSWDSTGGSRMDFLVGCPRAAGAVSRCVVQGGRWILLHLAVRAHFEYSRWVSRVSQPVQRTPLWPASWLPVLDKSRGSKSAEVQRVWGIYDDRLQLMSRDDVIGLDGALENGDVSQAWSMCLLRRLPLQMLISFRVVLGSCLG